MSYLHLSTRYLGIIGLIYTILSSILLAKAGIRIKCSIVRIHMYVFPTSIFFFFLYSSSAFLKVQFLDVVSLATSTSLWVSSSHMTSKANAMLIISKFIPKPDFSSELQTCMFNSLLHITSWKSNRCLERNISETVPNSPFKSLCNFIFSHFRW